MVCVALQVFAVCWRGAGLEELGAVDAAAGWLGIRALCDASVCLVTAAGEGRAVLGRVAAGD